MSKKTILVTGGAGFIGSHLIDRLLQAGHRVLCVDNLCTGSRDNIAAHFADSNFLFREHDIIEPIFFDEPINEIYNLACPASPVQYQENPVRTIKTNTIGMINMLGLAKAHGATILQASTSEVYGDPEIHPQTEEYRGSVNPIGPRACYDEGKRVSETLCFDYHRMHGMPVKVVRIFNTYGPRMAFDDGRVVSNFIVQALKNDPITIYGDGEQTRSFCYVDDLVLGLMAMMNVEPRVAGPINLGNPEELSIRELADLVITLTGSRSQIVFQPLPQDDPKQRRPDIDKAQKILGWRPDVSVMNGLQKTIENFRKRLSSLPPL